MRIWISLYIPLLLLSISFTDTAFDSNNITSDNISEITKKKSRAIQYADAPETIEVSLSQLINIIQHSDLISAAYFPGWNMVTRGRIDSVLSFCLRNNLNTIMVDLKNVRGELFFKSKNKIAIQINAIAKTTEGYPRTIDFNYLRHEADKKGIKIIGRFVMFRDMQLFNSIPDYRMEPKEKWVNLEKKEVIEYTIDLLKEATNIPIDEIALDYIRYPDVIGFGSSTKKLNHIEKIVSQASQVIKPTKKKFSIYVFGWVAWDRKQNIGQSISRLSPYVDVIYPMLYPSHFYAGSLGFRNPANHPYSIIEQGYNAANHRANGTTIIPMLQIFWYKPPQVLEQIKAVYCNNMPGFGCWNSKGDYKLLTKAFDLLYEELYIDDSISK